MPENGLYVNIRKHEIPQIIRVLFPFKKVTLNFVKVLYLYTRVRVCAVDFTLHVINDQVNLIVVLVYILYKGLLAEAVDKSDEEKKRRHG